ncbi:hypothetical protein PUR28_01300, partial [Streptomyces sp. BE308]|uniref:hypothetical protein n=1 Tax=Streptomyces sp. BE308 TaxID=3002529 RepID=UPI002E7755A9
FWGGGWVGFLCWGLGVGFFFCWWVGLGGWGWVCVWGFWGLWGLWFFLWGGGGGGFFVGGVVCFFRAGLFCFLAPFFGRQRTTWCFFSR